LPKIQCTGAGNDITIGGIYAGCGINFDGADRFINNLPHSLILTGSELTTFESTDISGIEATYNDCAITVARIRVRANNVQYFNGGEISCSLGYIFYLFAGSAECIGVDFSGGSATSIQSGASIFAQHIKLKNCKIPATFGLFASSPSAGNVIELIGCSDTTSVGATSSIQDYEYEDIYGTVAIEATAVRTGGADDGATGGFAYAMTPSANGTLESSNAAIKSPWLMVWVTGGSTTATVYIANDTVSTDYFEDEVWCEFYTPDAGDTAQHDQNFDPATARLIDSSTAVTDDTGSTWGTGGNNHQKMSVTVTTGFEGWIYARVHLAKRQATPDTLYLDPKIVVT